MWKRHNKEQNEQNQSAQANGDTITPPESGGKNRSAQPDQEKKPSFPWKMEVAALGVLAVLSLAALLSYLSVRQPAPALPASAKPTATPVPAEENWPLPEEGAMDMVVFDDFNLSWDGSFDIVAPLSEPAVSEEGELLGQIPLVPELGLGYLRQYLKLDPPADFTVSQTAPDRYTVHIEGGEAIPSTLVTLPVRPAEYEDDQSIRYFSARVSPHLSCRLLTEDGGYNGAPIDSPIKVQFNDRMDFSDAKKHFSAPFDYDFDPEEDGRTVRLTPKSLLDYSKSYPVYVSKSFQSTNGRVMEAEPELSFFTEQRDFSLIMKNGKKNAFDLDTAVQFEYLLESRGKQSREASIQLYSVISIEDYTALLMDPADPAPARTPEGDAKRQTMKDGVNEVEFPYMEPGYYLAKTTVTDTKTKLPVDSYKPFMVCATDVYLESNRGQTLVWLNSSGTGQALTDHTLRFSFNGEDVGTAVTAADGTAVFTNSVTEKYVQLMEKAQEEKTDELPPAAPVLFTVYDPAGVPVYVDTTESLQNSYYTESARDRYYAYFYTDRALYRPTDTVHFWGYVRPYAYNTDPTPSTVTVILDPDGLRMQVEAPVRADGTFTGELSYEQIVSASYSIIAEIPVSKEQYDSYGYHEDGEDADPKRTIASQWVDVKDYHKPVYQISSQVEGAIRFYDEQVTVRITPSFYDGTPLPNYPLEFSLFNPRTGNFEETKQLTTDEKGVAVVSFKAGDGLSKQEQPWTPQHAYYYVKIANDGENVTHRGSYVYVPGKVMLRARMAFDPGGKNARLTVEANQIDLSGVKSQEQADALAEGYYGYASEEAMARYDLLRGEPADLELSVAMRSYYTDPTHYSWQEKNWNFAMNTKDGQGIAERLMDVGQYRFVPDYYHSLYAQISYASASGTLYTEANAYNGSRRRGRQGDDPVIPTGYYLEAYKNGESDPSHTWQEYIGRSELDAEAGDAVELQLCFEGRKVPLDAGGRMIYTVYQDRIIERGSAGRSIRLDMKQKYANSILVSAAYFDGRHVRPVANCYIYLDVDSFQVNIETESDKEAYLPGETVHLRAKVTYEDGSPAPGNVCFSVVDESVFALSEQYIYLPGVLYNDMYYYNYYVSKYTSQTGDYPPFSQGIDGGKGDGDNMAAYDIFRKNFKDTAFFQLTTAGEDGVAAASFTLPDNLTSWRITTTAVSRDVYGGYSKTNFVTTMPFFVSPVLGEKYLAGDSVAMLLQGHGTAVESDSRMNYTVRIRGDKLDKTEEYTGGAYEAVTVDFGKLPEGEYIITSTGQLGEMRDTVELPVAVIRNNLELVITRELDAPDGKVQIPATRYPTVITLYDAEYGAYYQSVGSLLTHFCGRTDQRMARYVGKRAFLRSMPEEALPQYLQPDDNLQGLQNDDGGVGWWSDWEDEPSDPVVTAKALLSAPEAFNQERMKNYFRQVVQDSGMKPEQQAAAWMGLGTLDQTVLPQLVDKLETPSGYTLEEKLYFVAGLAYGGDIQNARKYYDGLVTPILTDRGGQKHLAVTPSDKDYINKAESDRLTALAWMTAVKLNLPEADDFSLYLGRDSWRIDSLFECMIYVSNYSKQVPPLEPIRYLAGGETRTAEFSRYGCVSLKLGKSELADLTFYDLPERIHALCSYVGEPEEADMKPSELIGITKEITPEANGKYKNTITVKLASTAPYGHYSISDWVPTNMRLHTFLYSEDGGPWVRFSQEQQKLYFDFYHSEYSSDSDEVKIVYYTQKTYDAQAVADRTYIVCAESGDMAFTERTTVK